MAAGDPREELWGWEWDFLAVDAAGAVALLSSAGHGPIPAGVLNHRLLVERAVSELVDLPILGAVADRRDAGNQSADYSDWFAMSERGLFAYDWQGAYRLVSSPTDAISISTLSPTIREAASLLTLPVRFAHQSTLVVG